MRTTVDRCSFCRERARDDRIIVHGPYGSHICSRCMAIARDYLTGITLPPPRWRPARWWRRLRWRLDRLPW
jgi:hypothetical protein